MREWERDDCGLRPDDHREIAWSIEVEHARQRIKAIGALWGKPIKSRPRNSCKGWDIYDGYVRNRDEEWTFWRALRATIAIALGRYGDDYRSSCNLAWWDAFDTYGGYTIERITLSAGWRVSIFNDGECLM